MPEEVGIVMTLYDRVSPTLKAIAGNNRAFDKTLDELEESLRAYGTAQDALVKKSASQKQALEGVNQKVADARKRYKELKDETSKGALDDAIREQAELKQELKETEQAIRDNNAAYKELYKNARNTASALSAADNRAGGSAGSTDPLSGLAKGLLTAGVGKLAADAASSLGGTLLSSAVGEPQARLVSSILSGAISGGTMGAVLGAPGIAAGAIVGGLSGAASGYSEIFQARDDAFRSYVQEAAEGQLSDMSESITSGSSIAGSREQKQLAFSTLLGGDGAAADFLSQVKAMAAETNYTYDEITGYAKSLVGPFGAGQTLDILNTLSDASAALSLNESDNAVLIAGLTRMKLTDKTTQEYLNYFSERGVDVYEALSRWGDAAAVAEKVTKGEIRGGEAVEEILSYLQEQYGGLSARMAETFEGMSGNLEDAQANAEEAYGAGYNEARKEGIQAQTDWLSSGAMDEANRAIGAWQAELENQKEAYIREAVNAALGSEEYEQARAAGDAAEMGRLIMQAKVRGMSEYNASEGAQEALAAEKALAEGIRNDAALNQDYWDAGYEHGQMYTKGLISTTRVSDLTAKMGSATSAAEYYSYSRELRESLNGHAYGLGRVPYDNYAALLHEGERVLTAREAREADRGGGAVTVNIGGSWQVRSDSDVDAIAEAIVRRARLARLGGIH